MLGSGRDHDRALELLRFMPVEWTYEDGVHALDPADARLRAYYDGSRTGEDHATHVDVWLRGRVWGKSRGLVAEMANGFGTDILIQAPDPRAAAGFYERELGFAVTDESPKLISLHGEHINLFIEQGPALGPILEVFVDDVEATKARLIRGGCTLVKDEPEFPRYYLKDPFGLTYNIGKARRT